MKLTEFFLNELDREVERSRKALEQVPDGKYDWKPHERSMIFGYLANMVATIPMWLTMQITRDELDIAPAEGSQMKQTRNETSEALVKALDEAAAGARAALGKTTEEHLMTNWQLLARGQVVAEAPRHLMMQDTIKTRGTGNNVIIQKKLPVLVNGECFSGARHVSIRGM